MVLEELALKTIDIIGDYQNDFGVYLTAENVIRWANQFNEDAEFVLAELNLIFEKTYISKPAARELLKNRLVELAEKLNYNSMLDFISYSDFIVMQRAEKSQVEIIQIIDEILLIDYGLVRSDYTLFNKKNYIYFDDLIATGGTVCGDLCKWLLEESNGTANHIKVVKKEIRLIVSCFCAHFHSFTLMQYILMKSVNNDNLQGKWDCLVDYSIMDHPTQTKQEYNCIMPLQSELSQRAIDYWNSLDADRQINRAFRPMNSPTVENFFSSALNRSKLERIFVEKGLDILMQVGELNSNHRPLGVTRPSHKTLGLGTLFFTWRNIPNNCPIVFWWSGHNWFPLFPLRNRGN